MTEFGTKRECDECSTKFYDLGRAEIICPKCGWNPNAEAEPAPAKKKAKSGKK